MPTFKRLFNWLTKPKVSYLEIIIICPLANWMYNNHFISRALLKIVVWIDGF